MSFLILNSGSSSLKLVLFDSDSESVLLTGLVQAIGTSEAHWQINLSDQVDVAPSNEGPTEATNLSGTVEDDAWSTVRQVLIQLEMWGDIQLVVHRLVHGGSQFSEATRLTPEVCQKLESLTDLAPLHLPRALGLIRQISQLENTKPQVAVFDTAYYRWLPPSQYLYPVPYSWFQEWGIRRYGFHGLSHQYCAETATRQLKQVGRSADRLIICHLGNGCSVTAIQSARPVATSMGFTPLDGVMMGSRSGSIDPGILFYLEGKGLANSSQLSKALNQHSGLLGVSGVSNDFRAVTQAAVEGNERAGLALEMFADRIRQCIGAYATVMNGLDALVFTGGIGQNSAALRAAVCGPLEFLGCDLDSTKNTAVRPHWIDNEKSRVSLMVIETREELTALRLTKELLQNS